MAPQTIFCVEDDESIRELVLYALRNNGFECRGFETAAEFFSALGEQSPDLVLLDIMLPGEDGLSILSELRKNPKTGQLPVIMLTAKSSEYDKVVGLDLGADDYVTKPFGVVELVSRIKAVLRRYHPGPAGKVLACGGITLDYDRRTVLADGVPVTITFKEFELLHYLMKNAGMVLSRDKIMESVWGFDYEGESRTVDMHIKTLRQKLGACASLIETVRGVGYRIGG